MSFGTTIERSIVTIPTAFTVPVAAATTQVEKPPAFPADIQSIIKTAVSTTTHNSNIN